MTDTPNLLADLSGGLARVAEDLAPSVVEVRSGHRSRASGILWRPGLAVCADESLAGEGRVTVGISGQEYDADVAGRDPTTDIALLRFSGAAGNPAVLHPALEPKPGEIMLAVGRRDHGLAVRLGIVSMAGGPWQSMQGGHIDRLLRLDMKLDRFVEGGLLADAMGRPVGMAVRGPRRSALAIPAATIERVAARILEKGSVRPGYLGAGLHPVRIDGSASAEHGLMVLAVAPGGPANAAGVLQGDIVTAWNGEPIRHMRDVLRRLGGDTLGQTVELRILRSGQPVSLPCVIGERPAA